MVINRRFIVRSAIAMVTTIVFFEIGSAIVLVFFIDDEGNDPYQPKKSIIEEIIELGKKSEGNLNSSGSLDVHPYFGYVRSNIANRGINNYGFFSGHSYPYHKKANELVVGIFGGDAALQFYRYVERTGIFNNYLGNFVGHPAKEIVLLNFSDSGYKQPQQFIIFSYFLETLDIAICLDGYNDVVLAPPGGFPVEFPYYEALFQLTHRNIDRTVLIAISTLDLWQTIEEKVIWFAKMSYPSRTVALVSFLLCRSIRKIIERQSNSIAAKIAGTIGSTRSGATNIDDDRIEEMLANWRFYTENMQVLGSSRHIHVLSFLQPFPEFPSGDKTTAISIEKLAQLKRGIRQSVVTLNQRGIAVTDLNEIDPNRASTIFTDHSEVLNDSGNAMIAEVIGRKLVDRLRSLSVQDKNAGDDEH